MTANPATGPAASFQSPRAWMWILTVLGTALALGDIWTIIALDPGFLTFSVRGADVSQVGTWFVIVLASIFGVFAAVRSLVTTFVVAITARHGVVGPALASAAVVCFAAGMFTGHLLEYGCVALLMAMVARFFIHPGHSVSAD